ncbi:MAG: shikimate kinase [Pseudomonadota bacterium]
MPPEASRLLLVGNSSSGKSTLASALAQSQGLAHLDLDTLAWQPTTPPERRPLEQSRTDIDRFLSANNRWVIEGCYADLLQLVAPASTGLLFLDLPISACLDNARKRPWEPHKYATPEAQEANLAMLLDWIAAYAERDDVCSRTAHQVLYDGYAGFKRRITRNTVAEDLEWQ